MKSNEPLIQVVILHGEGGKLLIAKTAAISVDIFFDISASITIGQHTIISKETAIYTHEHGHECGELQLNQPITMSPLAIRDDVYIGMRTIILASCNEIGEGAVIGAQSVVTRDIPPYTIWAGNPAKQIGERK